MGVATVYLVYELGKLLYGSPDRPRRGAPDGPDALPRRRDAPGPPRRADDDASPRSRSSCWRASSSVGGPRGCTRLARRWASRSCPRRRASSCSARLRVPCAHVPSCEYACGTWPSRSGVMALVIAPFPLSLVVAGHTGHGRELPHLAAVPAGRTTTGCSTRRPFRRPSVRWCSLAAAAALVVATAARRPGGSACSSAGSPCRWCSSSSGPSRATSTCSRSRRLSRCSPRGRCAGAMRSRRWRSYARRLLLATVARIDAPDDGTALAGSGGLPAGREAGEWIDANVPEGSTFMTIGPSMANLVQFYGHRRAYGLSVSPNPLNRNPSYEPLPNPDQALRDSEDPVRRLGHVLGRPLARSSRGGCCVTPSATTAAPCTWRRSRVDRRGPASRAAGDRRVRGAPVRRPRRLLRVLAAALVGAEPAAAAAQPATPIEHFVVLMQENHSFDNYFGTFPGADGIPPAIPACRCRARRAGRAASGRSGSGAARFLTFPTTPGPTAIQYARRRDGWLRPGSLRAAAAARVSRHGLLWPHDLPFHWNAAREYVLFDRFFAAAPGGSVANHLFWLTGTGGGHGGRIPDEGFGDLPTIFDRLERARGLMEVLRPGLRPEPHDRRRGKRRPQHTGGTRSAPELPALRARQGVVQACRRPGRVLRGP